MRKAKVTVPAVCTNIGPGIDSLALALGLHVTVTLVERDDTHFQIDSYGEDFAELPSDCFHPVMFAAIRVFQRLEEAPLGLRIDVRNAIPMGAGLGAEEAMTVAGLVGANSLMGTPLQRDELLRIGAEIVGSEHGLVAAMLGGLTASVADSKGVIHDRIDVEPFQVLVVVPVLEDYAVSRLQWPVSVDMADALYNLGRQVLFTEALRSQDFTVLGRVMGDHLLEPYLARHIPGFQQVRESARKLGAAGVTICGNGPALLVLAKANHYRIGDAMQAVFDELNVLSRVWTLTVDTQGVVVTAAEIHPR